MSLNYEPASEPLHISASECGTCKTVKAGFWPWLSGNRLKVSPLRSREDGVYRGTSLIRNSAPLGPCSGTMPRALWWPQGGGLFRMSEVPLFRHRRRALRARAFLCRHRRPFVGVSQACSWSRWPVFVGKYSQKLINLMEIDF